MKLNLPKEITINDLKMNLSQPEDNCGRPEFDTQDLEVDFQDGGGGFYYVLKTDRWAIDTGDRKLFDCLDEICEEMDKHSFGSRLK